MEHLVLKKSILNQKKDYTIFLMEQEEIHMLYKM